MTWLRYGIDETREKWYVEEKKKYKYFNERVLATNEIMDSAIDIDENESYKLINVNEIIDHKLLSEEAKKYDNPNPIFKKNKDFLSTSLISNKLDITSPFIKLATNKKVIATISKYMSHIPLLTAIELWHSRYYNDNLLASQLWHCDWENPKSMKIFVNISDVNVSNGPFTFLPENKSKVVRDSIKYTYGEPGYRISDEEMTNYFDDRHAIKLIGQDKLLFIDSCRCFHYGSRVSKGASPRILLLLKYLSPASINLVPSISKNPPFKYLINETHDIYSKYVFGHYTREK